ncbi:MAG: hypothetical protein N2C12_05225, partial [Planctomycetales bacterium]
MATRAHIAAAIGSNRDDFTQAFAKKLQVDPDQLQIEENGDWLHLSASVWGVDGSDLDAVLGSMAGPCLRATTEDDSRWYLHLFKDGEETFHMCYEFSLLDEDEFD